MDDKLMLVLDAAANNTSIVVTFSASRVIVGVVKVNPDRSLLIRGTLYLNGRLLTDSAQELLNLDEVQDITPIYATDYDARTDELHDVAERLRKRAAESHAVSEATSAWEQIMEEHDGDD